MKLYHISQEENNDNDSYSEAVVCAESEDEARLIHPNKTFFSDEYIEEFVNHPNISFSEKEKKEQRANFKRHNEEDPWINPSNTWCDSPSKVTVVYIGEAADTVTKGVVCSSFNPFK